MLTGEDVESWNKLFPDCQINNNNLGNPKEHFLINALVCYLRRFGYNIEPPFDLHAENKENNRETRLFLIKLTRQIDHFLKITDKSYSFTYYDLIRPTPKKTAHMLYILLNYYYYYNVYKEDVFKMAEERIHKLEELKSLVDQTSRDNVDRKEENKNIKSTIDNILKEIPKARAKVIELEKARTHQEEESQRLNHSFQELKEKLKDLEDQKKLLRKRVVTEDEFQELQNQLQLLKLDLEKHKEMEKTNGANLNECKESNINMQKLAKEIEKAHEIIPLRHIKQLQETVEQLARVQQEEYELKLKESRLKQEIEEENVKNKSLIQEQHNKQQEFQTIRNELLNAANSKQIALKQKDGEILRLEEENHISECRLEEQKDIAQYIQDNVSEILSAYE